MSTAPSRLGIRPPPPAYRDALRYPHGAKLQDALPNPQIHRSPLTHIGGKTLIPFRCEHQSPKLVQYKDKIVTHLVTLDEKNACPLERLTEEPDHIYQTLPDTELVLELSGTPTYNSIVFYISTDKKTSSGKPIILLEPIQETLASAERDMGVKTYTQLEVVEAGTETGNQLINGCATHAVKDGGAPYIVKEISSFMSSNCPHGLPVLNEAGVGRCGKGELCGHFENVSTDDENDASGFSTSSGLDNGVPESKAFRTDGNDFLCSNSLHHGDGCVFGSRDSVDKCIGSLRFSRENSVHSANDSFEGNGDLLISSALADHLRSNHHGDSDVTMDDTDETVVETEQLQDDLKSFTKALRNSVSSNSAASLEATPLLVHDDAQMPGVSDYGHISDCDVTPTDCQAHADSGFSECSRFECVEKVTENVETEIYSEPQYSSSEVRVKINDVTSDQSIVQYQKTLKRKYNGIDHTVYELSPSDSFHSSVGENIHRSGGPPSITSSDGISRLAHSSGSLSDQQKRRHSYKSLKPPASGRADDIGTKVNVSAGSSDAEPLMGPGPTTDDYAESIQTAVILADVRRDYKPTAADRGTMYCAFGGITVVAAVVFVLIYFS